MLVPALLLALAIPTTEPEPAPAAPSVLTPTTESRPRRRPLGPVGSGGIVLGGAGLGVAIAGLVRMSQPNQSMPDPTNDALLIVTDTRIQGGIVLGAGLAVAAAGATMLAVDLTVLRKRSVRRLAIAPVLSPSTVGLDLRLRFSLGWVGLDRRSSPTACRRRIDPFTPIETAVHGWPRLGSRSARKYEATTVAQGLLLPPA